MTVLVIGDDNLDPGAVALAVLFGVLFRDINSGWLIVDAVDFAGQWDGIRTTGRDVPRLLSGSIMMTV